MPCDECNDLRYVVIDGKRQPCRCLLIAKAEAFLRPLGKAVLPDEAHLRYLVSVPLGPYMIFRTRLSVQAEINGRLAVLLLRQKAPFQVLNVYELIEIYLGNYPEIRSIFSLRSPLLLLLHGYEEFENKRQPDIILQTLENRQRLGLMSWLVTKLPRLPERVEQYCAAQGYSDLSLDQVK